MGLFNFSNLIQPEHREQSQPIKSRISDPSFRDLVRDAVKKHEETKISDTKEEIVAVEPTLPAIPEPVVVVEEVEREIPSKQKEQFDKKLEINVEGTLFLKTLLSEFSDVLTAGKELDKLKTDKKFNSEEQEHIKAESEKEIEARKNISDSLSQLLTSETESENGDLLVKTLNSYRDYLSAFERKYSALTNQTLMEGNKLLMQINQKQKDIERLINQEIGGGQNFQQIKEIVSFCKTQRAEALGNIENVSDIMKNEISTNVVKFVEGDLHGSIMLAETGDLIGLMMCIYNAPQK